MNLVEALLAHGNAKGTKSGDVWINGAASALWNTGIHFLVYKKRGENFGMPYVRLEVDTKQQAKTGVTIAKFTVLDDQADTVPERMLRILDELAALYEDSFLEVDGHCVTSILESDRRPEAREGIWWPEIEFTLHMTKNFG